MCCYTGGFALNAAIGGAESVVAVDSSERAIDVARGNCDVNSIPDIIEWEVNSIEK